ncbi:MAG TPA: hypothetical protein VJY39_13590 [Acidisphaera sp.]|nr:hypothetical protein [Acidisphaera sp.]
MFNYLTPLLKTLYRRLIEARPYARGTRPRPVPPDDERPACGRDRHYRLEIAYDAFCEHRPPPKQLFRHNPARRDLTSWCDKPNSWTGRRKPRCHHCETARAHYIAARDTGDWKAEVALYKRARRGAVRLDAERRQWREQRRQFWARHRENVARNGPEPMPPQFEPELWPMIAHRGSLESWHHRDRREVERGLLRAHARHLRRQTQRRRERLRDLEAGRTAGCDSANPASRHPHVDDAVSAPPSEPRHCEDPGAAGGRGNPGPRDKHLQRVPGSPRRREAARDDAGDWTGLSEPPAEVAPPEAPAIALAPAEPMPSDATEPSQPLADPAPSDAPAPATEHAAPARISPAIPPEIRHTGVKTGAARWMIPPPRLPPGDRRR